MNMRRITVIAAVTAVLLATAGPALAQNTANPAPATSTPATVARPAAAPLPATDDEATEHHPWHASAVDEANERHPWHGHHLPIGLLGLLGLLGLAGLRRR